MKCPQCQCYEQKTSYGTEIIRCNNEQCPYREEESEDTE